MTKHYFVVYKSYQKPGLEHFEVDAANKAEARRLFLEANIKHDYIIKIILWDNGLLEFTMGFLPKNSNDTEPMNKSAQP